VDAVGDIDGDGFNDILVGAGGRNGGQQTRAIAALYSGRTGGLLFSFSDGFSEYGAAVAGRFGDVLDMRRTSNGGWDVERLG
jgi:hypothetical protein